MLMNYFSYFMCIAFSNFVRQLANHADEIDFNYSKPSYSIGFQKIVYASSRIAILAALDLWIGGTTGIIEGKSEVYIGIVTMCVLLPCIASFLIVFLLPKAFLSRLLRKWKDISANEIIGDQSYSHLSKKKQKKLKKIFTDKMPLVKLELAIAVVAVAVDIASIAVTVMLIIGQRGS